PMSFTMEFIENQILETANASGCLAVARVRLNVYRNSGGTYLPSTNDVSYTVSAVALESRAYAIPRTDYEVDLYKDFYVTRQLLSSIKSTNKIINVTGSIFAAENGLQNCLLLNDQKNVVEALNGN